ncbi:phytanoyl-CoA dioxygenase family protein [Paludisphaera mucosa]|uniref:Phytanoyl-CoA dioxygenase family protein n=1 Tax=Paludisphaera mucosa TaxID=3030827 RepID=A0ABT6FK91_9BACT|nr:phytanoyl-CoA dioxygenase family protein [Paludisphaera mucosa]MDG3007970.1 phytanoyl-CoA dioxygenase family protein [Paludisphaera mucosa]
MLEAQGFEIVERVLGTDACETLAASAVAAGRSSAGTRNLLAEPWCRSLAEALRPALARLIPASFAGVQCTYFEKSRKGNWLVPMHQDLSIAVSERVEHPDLRGWSEKEGGLFVQPPDSLLAELLAVRVHLDPCGLDDGPLRVVPGSHRLGRIDAESLPAVRRATPEVACVVDRGGVLVMRPLLLHASSKATGTGRRRVLHFLFGPAEPPCGLRWRHVV